MLGFGQGNHGIFHDFSTTSAQEALRALQTAGSPNHGFGKTTRNLLKRIVPFDKRPGKCRP